MVKNNSHPPPQAQILYAQIQLFFMKTAFSFKMFASETLTKNQPALGSEKNSNPSSVEKYVKTPNFPDQNVRIKWLLPK